MITLSLEFDIRKEGSYLREAGRKVTAEME